MKNRNNGNLNKNSNIRKETEMDQKLKDKVELSILYDFYGELLKDHNKEIFEDYILNDLSLGEIALEQGISRQGIYDIVRRCSKKLRDCEDRLHLVKKFESTKIRINRMKELMEIMKNDMIKDNNHPNSCNPLEEMIELADNILQDF